MRLGRHRGQGQKKFTLSRSAATATSSPTLEGDDWVAGGTIDGVNLPQTRLVTTFTRNTDAGTTHSVSTLGEFNTALAAQASQNNPKIVITANIDFAGSISPPRRTGTGDCQIISSNFDSATPPKSPGQRVVVGDLVNMKRLRQTSQNSPLFLFAYGASRANNYRIIGLELTTTANQQQSLVEITGGTSTLADIAEWIGVDRCYIYGVPHATNTTNLRRGILMDGKSCYCLDSSIVGIRDEGNSQGQGIAMLNAPGPLKIVNNGLQVASENFFSGGSSSLRTPSDIEFRYNHLYKDPAWEGVYPVHNHVEFKFARRVYMYGNVMDYCWTSGQTGTSVLFVSTSQTGVGDGAQYKTSDIILSHGLHRYYQEPFRVFGSGEDSSQSTDRILLKQLVFAQARSDASQALISSGGGAGGALTDCAIKRCTVEMKGLYWHLNVEATVDINSLTVTDCILTGGVDPNWDKGPFGASGGAGGSTAIANATTTSNITGNACRSTWTASTISGNTSSVASTFAAMFTNYAGGDYSVAAGNWAKGVATGGADPGADWTVVSAAIQYTESGQRPAEI